ncbi:MAG: hypothetical protein D6713_10010, partial [Deltaproteobacteria bacterium]
MLLFLVTFFSIYGGANLYFYYRLRSAVDLPLIASVLIGFFLFFLTLCPVLIRLLERAGAGTVARIIAFPGYFWMGFLFLFLAASLFFFLAGIFIGLPASL